MQNDTFDLFDSKDELDGNEVSESMVRWRCGN